VVIGILIALQINNQNQNRLNKIQEKRIFTDVLEEFQFHKFLNNKGNSRMEEVLSSSKNLPGLIENPPESLNTEQIDLYLYKLSWIWVAATPANFIVERQSFSETKLFYQLPNRLYLQEKIDYFK